MSEPRLLGVAVTYRRPDDLRRSLEALSAQTRRLDLLAVVNNDPEVDVAATVKAFPAVAATVMVLDSPENVGPAGGIALGMEAVLADASDADFVVVLDDDDPLIDERVLEDLYGVVCEGRHDRLGGVGLRGALLDRRTGRLRRPAPERLERAGFVPVDYLKSDWSPAYSVAAIRAIGTFDRALFFGFDDLEFGLRLNAAGYAVEAHLLGRRHAERSPGPSLAFRRSEWRTYYTLRNLLVILRRHAAPSAIVLAVLSQGVVKPLLNLVRRGPAALPQCRMAWRAVADAATGRLGRTVAPDTAKFADI